MPVQTRIGVFREWVDFWCQQRGHAPLSGWPVVVVVAVGGRMASRELIAAAFAVLPAHGSP